MESQLKCPKCNSVIYSRRNRVCGRCGEKLPESVMFDAATRNKVDSVIKQDKKRKEWVSRFPGHATGGSGMNSTQ